MATSHGLGWQVGTSYVVAVRGLRWLPPLGTQPGSYRRDVCTRQSCWSALDTIDHDKDKLNTQSKGHLVPTSHEAT